MSHERKLEKYLTFCSDSGLTIQFELLYFRKRKDLQSSAAHIQPVMKLTNTSILEECYILIASEQFCLEVNTGNIKYKFIIRLQSPSKLWRGSNICERQ